ncbi:hTAFII28-like protein conserved region-domain-containing protein [Neurospora tetraspora]|uniref:HTAFII28-like protein conserved region-domain-containing protein n=1 Tax=Neurospora tetraspora TaxID=94610 RepID=A0AAE0JJA9_9PEZI|nr:hTAFII28-like protein conserved region-domain-containing protein [Neurospora tetraspora]
MASPPHNNYSFPGGARSPPHLPSLTTSSLSKKRAADGAGPSPNMKRRKGSVMSIGSAHPLRQTSFPPDEAPGGARSPSVDIDAMSYVSGTAQSVGSAAASAAPTVPAGPPKKKRGRKSKAEKAREQTPSVVAGTSGKPGTAPPSEVGGSTVGRGAKSAAGGKEGAGGQGQEDQDDDEGPTEVAATADTLTKEQKEEEHRQRGMLINAFSPDQFDRFENWRAANLSKAGVRRLINATISQSVTENVVIGMRAVAKVFIGDIIEGARRVQAEWIEKTGEKQTDLPSPPATPHAAASNNPGGEGQGQSQTQGSSSRTNGENKEGADAAAEKSDENMPDASQQEKERDDRRGPLRPEHLREALRRYKMSFEGGGVGMQLIWHQQQQNGVERFPTRTGGRRIFR